MEFLRYERNCKLVCMERSPFIPPGGAKFKDPCNPDVLGVTQARRVVEIELKRTMADFKANRDKTSLFRRGFLGILPSQFYFMIPPCMEAKVLPLLEDKEGLLVLDGRRSTYTKFPTVRIARPAAVIKESRPLTLPEMVRMVSHQTGTLASALVKIARQFDEQPLVEGEPEKSFSEGEKTSRQPETAGESAHVKSDIHLR